MNVIKWSSELRETKNTKSGKTRYYIQHLEGFRRVSKAEYMARYGDGDTICNIGGYSKGDLQVSFRTVQGSYYKRLI